MPDEVIGVSPAEQSAELVAEPMGVSKETVPAPEKEVPPEGLMERRSEQYAKILSQVQPGQTTTSDDEVETDAQTVGALEAAEQQVHKLVELAQVKGVAHAVRVAKKLNDFYVLDTMHDELADRLYDGLVAKGLIAKE